MFTRKNMHYVDEDYVDIIERYEDIIEKKYHNEEISWEKYIRLMDKLEVWLERHYK